jgi:nucleoside 2-deoxyribosyltransferase
LTSIYLAHPHSDRERGLILQAKLEALGFEVINPFISVEQKIWDAVLASDGKFTAEHVRGIVEGDLRKIEESDAMVAMVTGKASAGTHMEVFYGSRILHRPVFSLYESIYEGHSIHPWYRYLTKPSLTEESLLKALKESGVQ